MQEPDGLSYADRATSYAQRVVDGKILAGDFVRMACERHLRDLQRQNSEGFPYYFNPVMTNGHGHEYRPGNRVCTFIELLPHVKGKWAREGRTIQLEDWQIFFLCEAFGWINTETALRRFRTAYLEVPRKNAKTTIAAGCGLYCLMCDDEAGAEVVSAATSADQAKISWSIAKQMVVKSPGMQKRFGVAPYANAITVEHSASSFKYLSSDHKTLDGLNTSAGIMDEVHAMRTREVWDVIETATGAREQPLLLGITTAGSNRAGIAYEQRDYVIKLLKQVTRDETYFGIIYTIDEPNEIQGTPGDDWTNPDTWAKANPNLGVSVFPDDLQRKCDKAKAMPAAQNNFLTKHLNVWVNADVAWMDMRRWQACGDENLTLEDFAGQECYTGLDLASKVDIAAQVKLFWRTIDDKRHYYAFGRYWLPEDTIETSKNDQYSGWEKSGRLIATPGNIIDFDWIEDEIKLDMDQFKVLECAYDPHQATQLSTRMMAEGVPMVEMRAIVPNFSEPMKELEALVLDGRFHHDGCPILTWMVSNVVAHYDRKDNIYPVKERPENKIDGVVALIMALGRAIKAEISGPSVYEKRGIIRLT